MLARLFKRSPETDRVPGGLRMSRKLVRVACFAGVLSASAGALPGWCQGQTATKSPPAARSEPRLIYRHERTEICTVRCRRGCRAVCCHRERVTLSRRGERYRAETGRCKTVDGVGAPPKKAAPVPVVRPGK
jgi:hypothetical protein